MGFNEAKNPLGESNKTLMVVLLVLETQPVETLSDAPNGATEGVGLFGVVIALIFLQVVRVIKVKFWRAIDGVALVDGHIGGVRNQTTTTKKWPR